MADEAQRFTTRTGSLQSRIANSKNAKQQQAASSSAAAKSGSTTTPTITSTPKVTNTAKAMPSVTRVDISKLAVPTVTPTVTTPREQAMNLLGSKTRVEPLRVADRSNLLNPETEKKDIKSTTLPLTVVRAGLNLGGDIAKTVTHNLYEQGLDWVNDKFKKLETARENINKTVGEGAIDFFNYVKEDISTDWKQGEGLGMVKDTILNTAQGLPRGIARVEYGLSELLDWGIDAQWATDLKNSIKSDLDYWENTRTYKKIKETESFSDFLKNPLMYAGGTLTEMLPMFINAWVAVPTTFAQIYGETYEDYSQDESIRDSGLTDNQVRLMSLGVAGVNTIIELGSDLVQGLMPWTKTITKTTEKEVRKSLTKPFMKVLSRFVKGGASEGFEEVFQNEIQDQVAGFSGSDRELPTRVDRLTTFGISAIIGWILQGGNVVVNVKQNKETEAAFNEWSDAVDKIAPGVSKDDKITLFSSIVAAEVEDANMSEDRVAKYEAETTELYNRIDELEQKLNTTTNEEEKQEINRQIEDANQKIKNIDEIINKGNKVVEEVNRQLQELSQKRMEAQQEEETQAALEGLYNEINGRMGVEENLSEQTMNVVSEEKGKQIKLPDTPEGYKSFAEALKQPNNVILSEMSDEQLKELRKKVYFAWEEGGRYGENSSTYRFIVNSIGKELLERELGLKVKKPVFKNLKDYVNKMAAIDKKNGKTVDRKTRKKYVSDFLRTNLEGDFAAHLPGLKGVSLKQIEGEITDEKIKKIAEMIALVSTTFGIDFNKIISGAEVSLNIADDIKNFLYNTDSLGQMTWKATKDMIADLIEREGVRVSPSVISDIARMGVIVTLNRGINRAGSIMSHELFHLIDFALSTREGLPLYVSDDSISYTSIIEGDNSWKTFKEGSARRGTKEYKYYNEWTEILARYAEEYFAYKNAPEVFKQLSNRTRYWSEEEFLKLKDKFESFINSRIGENLLDAENKFYYDVVRRINQGMYNYKTLQYDTEGMNQTEVELKLLQIESEYAWILQTVENMKGDLKEEMEAYVQLSNLQSNYEMAKAKGEEYLRMQKTTQQQQNTMDTMTETIIPNPPSLPQTIMYGLPYYGGSNIENGIGDLAEGGNGEKLGESYMKEQDIIKMRKKKNKWKTYRRELWNAWNDLKTPAFTRIYNRAPRIAGRLMQMEADTQVYTHRYRMKAKGFVDTLGKLEGKQALEVKMALLDYGALASQQTEDTIQEYKKQEVDKLKEVLKKNGFKEEDINNMFEVLNDIGRQYQDAGLNITLTDLYFPRVVKDYEGLIDYMNRVSGNDIKVNKTSLLIKIRQIQSDPDMTAEEKEARIRNAISIEFRQPGTTSQHGKERKMGKLSDWGEGIFAYYENPIESIDHYISTMVNAIQRQLFLGGMRKDANIAEEDMANQGTSESVSTILGKLVEEGMVDEEDVDIIQKNLLAVLNKKSSPKVIRAITDITYIATITNFISAINQLDDLGVAIIKDKAGFKEVVKAIFNKAGIKYDDLGLDDAYEMFREGMGISNWLFKKSGFNAIDRLGKTAFVNAAWESLKNQSKNKKTRGFLYTRLESMYGKECADRMMEKIDSGEYNDNDGQIDIEILRDLLYQLGSTQPIFTSAMPVTYLNNPWVRPVYSLSSFTLKRIDMLLQGAKEIASKDGFVKSAAWLMGVSFYLALFGAVIGDAGDLLKKKKDETFIWNLINEGIEEALISGGKDVLQSWLKIWDLSDYDLYIYKRQGMEGLLASKITPFIFDLGKDVKEAIWEHDADEITDLAKYVPIFGKMVYYWCWEDMDDSGLLDLGGDLDLDLDLGGDLDLDLDGELLDL